jgi:hypothetical protein
MRRIRENPYLVAILGMLILGWITTGDGSAAEQKKGKASSAAKPAKRKQPAEVAAPSPPPLGDQETALASCKKHVESMLKESAVTRFQGDQELKIDHPNEANYDVSGWVTSQSNSGAVKRMDFLCHAQHSSGGLWTTKTSLYMDK